MRAHMFEAALNALREERRAVAEALSEIQAQIRATSAAAASAEVARHVPQMVREVGQLNGAIRLLEAWDDTVNAEGTSARRLDGAEAAFALCGDGPPHAAAGRRLRKVKRAA